MAGGIAGGVVGTMGGLVGTYFGIKNTTRPRERRLAVRLAVALWACLALACGWGLLGPRPWNQLGHLGTLPVLFILPMNRALERARVADSAENAIDSNSSDSPHSF